MKQFFLRFTWLIARLAAIVSTCLGCGGASDNAGPSDPHEIRWRGQDSGYESTSTGTPPSNSNSGANQNP